MVNSWRQTARIEDIANVLRTKRIKQKPRDSLHDIHMNMCIKKRNDLSFSVASRFTSTSGGIDKHAP